MKKIYFETLGCSKNDVDTSLMKGILDDEKYIPTEDVREAEVIIVNSCGFIDSAKEESIETTFECAKFKNSEYGRCERLVMAGCLAERYSDELLDIMPELDGILGTGNIKDINEFLDEIYEDGNAIIANNINAEYTEGFMKKPEEVLKSEYVKISEGCNNNCTYCIIPKLRGRNRSRNIEDIKAEVEYLAKNGTEEVILIAQNTTDYGIDNYKEYKLSELIREISEIKGIKWIRVMYLYPDHFTDELIDEFKNNDKLLKYVDIPLQHISNNMLKKMNRKTNTKDVENLIRNLREKVPGIVIRTTFIVGFPGETEEDFEELFNFIKNNPLDKVGAFVYSREEDTVAYSMNNQIDEDIKEERLRRLMSEQVDISAELLERNVGKTIEVLIEEDAGDRNYIGRSYMDSPEIDGVVYVKSDIDLEIGSFVNVKINETLEYDLVGERV